MRLKKMLTMMMVAGAALVLVMLPTSGLFAEGFAVTGGTLTVTAHEANFVPGTDTWEIDDTGTSFTPADEAITVTDPTGENEGWIVTINFADFTATGIADPSVDSATLSLNADVEDWLSVVLKDSSAAEIVAQAIAAVEGTAIVSDNYTANDTIASSGNLAILEIQPGYGAGEFALKLDYQIDLTQWLPDGTTITSSADSGVFKSSAPVTVNNASQKYQIFPGTYETTITYGIAGNPAA